MKNISLFQDVSEPDLAELTSCLEARTKCYCKGESIYDVGDQIHKIGMVLSGSVHIVKLDAWGNQNIIAEIGFGELFAEAFVCGGVETLPVSVIAAGDCEVMFINFRRIITQCSNACKFHSLLIRNIIGILARKNITLQSKMEHITKRTTREKLLSYLSEQSRQLGSTDFDIPFDRQGLADYLSVERSALSAEMSRLKADGVIDYHKNHFKLIALNRLI